jgi:tetratricopeptide (TPR) repeat protein
METAESLIGTVLADRYEIQSVLGQGGMGAVFRARRVAERDIVAVKILPPEDTRSSLLPRFLREARLAARVRHPHVVKIHDFGRWGPERDRYYLAMELVDGIPFDELLDAGFDAGTCAGLADQILDALAHVHARGILHRDIKPENAIVSRLDDGLLRIKLLDFGIAAAYEDEEATRLTQEGAALGTPAYMAPEQAEGKTLEGPVTDLYPVGVILYRLLSGHMPFEGSLTSMLIAKIQSEPPALKARAGIELDPQFGAVIQKLVARLPEDRFGLAPDVRTALAPFITPPKISADGWAKMGGRGGRRESEQPTFIAVNTGDETLLPEQAGEPDVTAERLEIWGRRSELARLDSIGERVETGEGQVALIHGPAGIGKTEVLKNYGIKMAESGRFLTLHTGFDRGGGRQSGVRAALEGFLGTSGESRAGVERACRELLRRYGEEDPDEVAQLLDFLRPRVDTQESAGADQRERRFAVFVRVLRRMARDRPVLLVLDDIDAGGADAAAFVAFVLFELGFEPCPLLLLVSYRDHHGPEFGRGLARSDRHEGSLRHTLALGPLGETDMVEWLRSAHGLSPTTAKVVFDRSGGNPLFAEHLARAGAEALDVQATLSVGSSEGQLPPALSSLLAASLDERLSACEDPELLRDVLNRLSVLGVRAPADMLESFMETHADRLDDALDELIGLGILKEEASVDEVAFAQTLLRDAVLAGIGQRRARKLHRRAAEIREAREDAKLDAGAIADHWDAAGQTDKAVPWWIQAVDREIAEGQAMLAARWGQKAYMALSPDGPERARLGIRLGRLCLDMGELDMAEDLLGPLLTDGDADAAMLAGEVLADLRETAGKGEAFKQLLEQLGQRVDEASETGQGAYHNVRALALNYQGRYPEALEAARQACAMSTGESALRAKLRLAVIYALLGQGAEATRLAEEAVDEAADESAVLSRALRSLGFIYFQTGRSEDARAVHQRALELARRTGRSARIPVTIHDLAACHAALDDIPVAREAAEAAVRAAKEQDLENVVIFAELKIASFDLIENQPAGVLARFDEVVGRARAAGMHMLEGLVDPVMGWALALQGQHEEATERFRAIDGGPGYPAVFEVGHILESIGFALTEMTLSGTYDYRELADTYLGLAIELWKKNNPKRIPKCEETRARLEAGA